MPVIKGNLILWWILNLPDIGIMPTGRISKTGIVLSAREGERERMF